MKCPKCGKTLKTIKLRSGNWLGHSYTLAYVMSDKLMCDYSSKKDCATHCNK